MQMYKRPNKKLSITPYHANIKEGRFNVDFFSSFAVVLNGLDNVNARQVRDI